MKPLTIAIYLSLNLIGFATEALADAPTDLRDLAGVKLDFGNVQMEARGYQFVRESHQSDQPRSFWRNRSRRTCTSIVTQEGRYLSIAQVPEASCEKRADGTDNAVQDPELLVLVCIGEAQHTAKETQRVRAWNKDKESYETTHLIESAPKKFKTVITLEIQGATGRIHLEDAMIPPANSGETDGWWPLQELKISADSISGNYYMNLLKSPSITVDRKSGIITTESLQSFSGRCEKSARGERKF